MTPRRRLTLPQPVAFGLLTSIVLMLLASSSAPTPLYATYGARWGFTPITVTVVFGVYAVAVLASLLVLGALSDHVGRRPVLLFSLLTQAGVMVIFATADGTAALLAARVLQGLATGAALGAVGAGLVDLHPAHGPVANASGALAGTASGAIGSAVLVQLLPAPTQLVYLVLLGAFLIQAAGVTLMTETATRRPGAVRSLQPRLAVPTRVRRSLLIAAPSLVAVWSLGGFYGSLSPSLFRLVAGSHSTILSGSALFALAGAGALTILRFHRTDPERFALAGSGLIILGVSIVLAAVAARSLPLLFLGTIVAGAGFGAGFQGGLRSVLALAGPSERAGVISVAYIISYLALGLPAILAGVLVTHGTVTGTAEEFGGAVILLAALTAAGLIRSLRPAGASSSTTDCTVTV